MTFPETAAEAAGRLVGWQVWAPFTACAARAVPNDQASRSQTLILATSGLKLFYTILPTVQDTPGTDLVSAQDGPPHVAAATPSPRRRPRTAKLCIRPPRGHQRRCPPEENEVHTQAY